MKLCTQSEYTFKNIIGYRDITNFTRNKNGSVIFKMAAKDKVNLLVQFLETDSWHKAYGNWN